jgi:hypothetical protein
VIQRLSALMLGVILAVGVVADTAAAPKAVVLVGDIPGDCDEHNKEFNGKLPAPNGALVVWLKIDPSVNPTSSWVANIDRVEGNTFVPVITGQQITLVACAPPYEKWRSNAIAYSGLPPATYRLRLFDPAGVPIGEDFFKTG